MPGQWLARSRGHGGATAAAASTRGTAGAGARGPPRAPVLKRPAGSRGSDGPPTPERKRPRRTAGAPPRTPGPPTPVAARPRPPRKPSRRIDPELDALVGPACESAEAHWTRHRGYGNMRCPRCRWYKVGPSWVSAYGTIPSSQRGPDEVHWPAERPSLWGGPWGLGCTICAQALRASSSGASTPVSTAGGHETGARRDRMGSLRD